MGNSSIYHMRVGKEIVKCRTILISLIASLATIEPVYALPSIFNNENERSEEKLFSAYCGGAYGAENPIGLIKLGAGIRPFNKVAYLNHFYFGITGSVWFIVAGIGSIGAESGLIFNRFSIDGSLTLSELASWEAYRSTGDSTGMYRVGPAKKLTFNPKIGIRFGAIWIRVGPSIELKEYIRESDKLNSDAPPLFKYFLKNGSLEFPNVEALVKFHFP